MIFLISIGIAILFLLAIFVAGVIGAWLIEHLFGLGK